MTCKQNRIGMTLGVLALSLAATQAAAAECGRVSIANMNWQSAEVLAEVDKIILEKGYGCEVELGPGDTMPTMSSMTEKGQPDVAPELWPLAVYVPLTAAINGFVKSYNVSAKVMKDLGYYDATATSTVEPIPGQTKLRATVSATPGRPLLAAKIATTIDGLREDRL